MLQYNPRRLWTWNKRKRQGIQVCIIDSLKEKPQSQTYWMERHSLTAGKPQNEIHVNGPKKNWERLYTID